MLLHFLTAGDVYLVSGQEFDYETLNSFTLTFQVRDYLESGDSLFTLTVSISDVNEPPYFTGVPDSFTVNESLVSY